MKRLFFIVPCLLGLILSSCYKDELEKLKNRLDDIENIQISSINQQVTSIKTSLSLLSNTDKELKEFITVLVTEAEALEAKFTEAIATEKTAILAELEATNNTIAELKTKDKAIEEQIAKLQEYVDSELKGIEDWALATFATLEQYNALAKEVVTLKTYTESVESTLSASITALEKSMKEWVNEQLTGYYTIAEIDAKIEALENSYAEGKQEVAEEIEDLQNEITNAKSELTEGYQNAIAEAINTNNGVINAKIAADISAVNEKIAGLEKRLDDIESRLSAIEDAIEKMKSLDIYFDHSDKACMAGASAYIGYTIIGGDTETVVEAWGDGGWSASVISESATSGKIKVTAPENATNGKVVVLATSGAGGVKMKTVTFEQGVIINISDTYEVDWEACTLQVKLQTNLDYTVEIPAEAQSWLSVAETRAALRNETLTFSLTENPEETPRSASVKLIGEVGDVLQSFDIIQKAQPADGYIEFADKYVKEVCLNKFDTNSDGEISFKEAYKVTTLGANGKNFFGDYAAAVISFDELQYFANLSEIDDYAFSNSTNLERLTLPNSITIIGERAFYGCSKLTKIIIPKSVTTIERLAFRGCIGLANVSIPHTITSIGTEAFYNCSSLASITIPTQLTVIDRSTFHNCKSLKTIVIPNNITSIEEYAFYNCTGLVSANIGMVCLKLENPHFRCVQKWKLFR